MLQTTLEGGRTELVTPTAPRLTHIREGFTLNADKNETCPLVPTTIIFGGRKYTLEVPSNPEGPAYKNTPEYHRPARVLTIMFSVQSVAGDKEQIRFAATHFKRENAREEWNRKAQNLRTQVRYERNPVYVEIPSCSTNRERIEHIRKAIYTLGMTGEK